MRERYDVVVVGAGPAGSAAAHYLALQGLDVLLVDKFNFPRDKTCGDGLPPPAVPVLEEMGVLEQLLHVGYCASRFHITAPNGHTMLADLSAQEGVPGYTMVVPRIILDNLLRERAVASGADFFSPAQITSVEPTPEQVLIGGHADGHKVAFRAQAAVLATGASTGLLKRLGLLSALPPPLLAARSYYADIRDLQEDVQFRFDSLPLPGYGWIFPLSADTANVGAGFLPDPARRRIGPRSALEAFNQFVDAAPVRRLLAGAHRTAPIKGYPLRTDFLTAPTFAERLVLVGEAAGLVNPLTGDGIDYALESGRLAAQVLGGMFADGDFSVRRFSEYDRRLRRSFQPLFTFCYRLRWVLARPAVFNAVAGAIDRDPGLCSMLLGLVLRGQEPGMRLTARLLLRFARNAVSRHSGR